MSTAWLGDLMPSISLDTREDLDRALRALVTEVVELMADRVAEADRAPSSMLSALEAPASLIVLATQLVSSVKAIK